MKGIFRAVARDETYAWNGLPAACGIVFGVYLFRVGEGTHVCSMTPSSRIDFIENVFGGIPSDHGFAEEHCRDDGGEAVTYCAYIDPKSIEGKPYYSEAREYEVEISDYENEAAARDALWEMALEDFQANAYTMPILEGIAP